MPVEIVMYQVLYDCNKNNNSLLVVDQLYEDKLLVQGSQKSCCIGKVSDQSDESHYSNA